MNRGILDGSGVRPPPSVDATAAALAAEAHAEKAVHDWVTSQLETLSVQIVASNYEIAHLRADHDKDIARLRTENEGTVLASVASLRHELVGRIETHHAENAQRFRGVEEKFRIVEERRVEQKTDTATAVTAALAAQGLAGDKQAIAFSTATDKSEKAVSETLGKQADLFKSTTDALSGQIVDLKDRVVRAESVREGGHQAYAGIYVSIAAMASLISIASVIFAVLVRH